jgi:precorrin-6B methylase 1
MLVAHMQRRLTISNLFARAKWSQNAVDFIKKHKKFTGLKKNILYPERLLVIICPIILIFAVSYKSFYDLGFGFLKYFAYFYERALIWKTAIKNRIFII